MTYRQLIAMCFILNGLVAVANKTVASPGMLAYKPLYLLVFYSVAILVTVVYTVVSRRVRFDRVSAGVGALAGMALVAATCCIIAAAALLPGYVVFPAACGGTLVCVAISGRLLFKEKIGAYGVLGIIAGVAAVVTLSL